MNGFAIKNGGGGGAGGSGGGHFLIPKQFKIFLKTALGCFFEGFSIVFEGAVRFFDGFLETKLHGKCKT